MNLLINWNSKCFILNLWTKCMMKCHVFSSFWKVVDITVDVEINHFSNFNFFLERGTPADIYSYKHLVHFNFRPTLLHSCARGFIFYLLHRWMLPCSVRLFWDGHLLPHYGKDFKVCPKTKYCPFKISKVCYKMWKIDN